MNKEDVFWQTYLNLENELIELTKYVFITDSPNKSGKSHQLETFSPFLADLIVRISIEIESISKELYFTNGGKNENGKPPRFDTVCLAYLDKMWNLQKKSVYLSSSLVNLTRKENNPIYPLLRASKGADKNYWIKCYQAVKHDRYNNLHLGNIKAVIQSLGALYLLNIYLRKPHLILKYSEMNNVDMSFGSRLFSVSKPDADNVLTVLNGNYSGTINRSFSSPFILKYTDSEFKRVIQLNRDSLDKEIDYLKKQPELSDELFTNFINERSLAGKFDKTKLSDWFIALSLFRLLKKIPKTLAFEQRRALLINTLEWKNRNSVIPTPKSNEIKEDNIDVEISSLATWTGYSIANRFELTRINSGFSNAICEMLLDTANVSYPKL